MSAFGEHLRRQRQMRGISLDEIVAVTKISRRHLQALEDEQFDLLPGGIFNRSYVRGYAKCVGIDEDEAVAEYLEAARETPANTRVIAQQHASLHSERGPEPSGFPLVPVLILLVVAAGGVGGWKMFQERQREKAQAASSNSSFEAREPITENINTATSVQAAPPAGGTVSEGSSPSSAGPQTGAAASSRTTAAASPAAATTSPTPAPSVASASAPSVASANESGQSAVALPFVLIVRPRDRAWVSIKADGAYIVRGIIDPTEAKTVRANSQIIFYAANAHSVELSFNGKDVATEEPASGPETLVFTAHGLAPRVPAQ